MLNLCALVLLADLVSVIPEMTVIPLTGESRGVEIMLRNTSALTLFDLRLRARSEGCDLRVQPERIERVRPSDRSSFRLQLIRTGATRRRRFPVRLSLSSRHHEKLHGLSLIADGREQIAGDEGWIDVGVVKIGTSKPRTRTLLFALLGIVPVALLLLLGWRLKRKARQT